MKRLLDEPPVEVPKEVPFNLQNPDVDVSEILTMKNIPSLVKKTFKKIYEL